MASPPSKCRPEANDLRRTELPEGGPGSVPAGAYWFVDEDISVADFDVVPATGIGTRPCFIVNRRPLGTVVRQWHQNANVALLTDRKLHCFHQDTLPYPARLGSQSGQV